MKKILCLILICIFLAGCSNDVSDKNCGAQEEITYTHEDVDATITYIDMRKWFVICPRWQWEIKAEYDGLTYEEGTKIYADNLSVKELKFAKYSTEAKAEKAMEMCRNRYAWCKIRSHGMNSLTMAMSFRKTDEIEQLLKTFAEENIFQFPADEEVE